MVHFPFESGNKNVHKRSDSRKKKKALGEQGHGQC